MSLAGCRGSRDAGLGGRGGGFTAGGRQAGLGGTDTRPPPFPAVPPPATAGSGTSGGSSPAAKRLGIMAGYLGALPGLVGFNKRVRNCDVPFPGARRLVASAFGLPTHTLLSERNVRALEQWIGGRDG